ncbi:MAG: DUF4743 domain-containing protein [Betaproteobacteria bacterium]|nr:DUF4743 domain-containing protein [Betaproteobacteria bacterium]
MLVTARARLAAALAPSARRYRPLLVNADIAGWVDDARAERLARFGDVFVVAEDAVEFASDLADEPARSDAMAFVAATLYREGALSAWRNERYHVGPALGAAPLFRLERAAARYFGVHTWAAHINGLIRRAGETEMWLARRSHMKAIDPDKLDNLVGGGVATGLSVAETLVKEAWEEASIPAALARQAQRRDEVEIRRQQHDGLQWETIFAHDLELPADFSPMNQDGEVAEFRLVALSEVVRLLNCAGSDSEMTVDAALVVLAYLDRIAATGSMRRIPFY